MAYGNALGAARKETKSDAELERWFPDCRRLHEAGLKILDPAYIRAYGMPTPALLAEKYCCTRTGMGKSSLHARIDAIE